MPYLRLNGPSGSWIAQSSVFLENPITSNTGFKWSNRLPILRITPCFGCFHIQPRLPFRISFNGSVNPMKYAFRLFSAALVALFVFPVTAQDFGVAARAGTTGFGGEAAYSLTRKLSVRGHFSTFSTSIDETSTDTDPNMHTTGDAKIGAVAAFLDYHPFANSFRLTFGAGKNQFDASGDSVPLESVCFGDEIAGVCDGKVFSPERLGTLGGGITYPSGIHPYGGIGFGNLARGDSRVTFMFDLGFFYTGAPELTLTNNGLFEPTTASENVQPINDGIESFAWYPVVSIGFGIRL